MVSSLLGGKKDIAGLVLLDMIGYAGVATSQFQINPGPHAASVDDGEGRPRRRRRSGAGPVPLYEPRYSDRSYLYNTDGIIFSENGYPVVLINEHINYYTRLMRDAYHETSDTSDRINFEFAVKLTKISIETVARLADVPPQ